MTNLSTVPYTYETGLIARLLGAVLEAAHAYGVRLLRVKEHLCTAAIYSTIKPMPTPGHSGGVHLVQESITVISMTTTMSEKVTLSSYP